VAGRRQPAGTESEDEARHRHDGVRYTVVGRLPRLGTPWDHAILVPIESVWETHGLGNGHTTDDGSLPSRWCDPANPYNEKALMVRALENTVYLAQSNVAAPDQGSVTGIVGPNGTLMASLPYGAVGVVTADIDLGLATRLLALRWSPERSVIA